MTEGSGERESGGLTPELQDVLSRALKNYQEGGLSAVEAMVDDLAVEASAVDSFADSGQDVVKEASERTSEEFSDAMKLVTDLESGHVVTMSRHSFAVWILEALRDKESNPDNPEHS